ncbi:MAG: hypothetical protein ABUT20_22480 [Bacteroidota bacterium]
MANKKILKVSLTGLIIILVLGLLASSLIAVNPSDTKACKEATPGSSKTNKGAAKNDIDLETLSGKFFS